VRSSMRKLVAVTAMLGAGLLTLAGPAGAASKAADEALAEGAVLVKSEVPATFTGGPQPDPTGPLPKGCKSAIVKAVKIARAAPNATSAFGRQTGTAGFSQVVSSVSVLPTEKKAKQVVSAYAKEKDAEACIEAELVEFFGDDETPIDVSVGAFSPELDDKGSREIITGGDQFLGYAGGLRRGAEGSQAQFYEFEYVVARVGRAALQLVIINSGAIPRADAQRWLQTMVTRLAPAA
jgi:hypothetical protein